MLYHILKYMLKPIVWILFRPKIYGRENLRVQNHAIFVCNHISTLDPVVIAMSCKRKIHFMAKAELFHGAFLNALFRALLAFPVNRSQTDMVSLKNAMRVLAEGEIFGIFPEGKRTITSDMDVIEKGTAFLAARSHAPIVPMYIKRDSYRKMQVKMLVGEPINTAEIIAATPKSQTVDTLTNEIERRLKALQTTLEQGA